MNYESQTEELKRGRKNLAIAKELEQQQKSKGATLVKIGIRSIKLVNN